MSSIVEKARDLLYSLELRQEPAVAPEIEKELMTIEEKFAAQLG